eukprot:355729-Chlamydomonas_euryale.AAC.3
MSLQRDSLPALQCCEATQEVCRRRSVCGGARREWRLVCGGVKWCADSGWCEPSRGVLGVMLRMRGCESAGVKARV